MCEACEIKLGIYFLIPNLMWDGSDYSRQASLTAPDQPSDWALQALLWDEVKVSKATRARHAGTLMDKDTWGGVHVDRRVVTTMAFHLLYSKSGLQFEDQLADFLQGLSKGDLGDLSPTQLSKVGNLQSRNIKEEMAKHQERVADSSMFRIRNRLIWSPIWSHVHHTWG